MCVCVCVCVCLCVWIWHAHTHTHTHRPALVEEASLNTLLHARRLVRLTMNRVHFRTSSLHLLAICNATNKNVCVVFFFPLSVSLSLCLSPSASQPPFLHSFSPSRSWWFNQSITGKIGSRGKSRVRQPQKCRHSTRTSTQQTSKQLNHNQRQERRREDSNATVRKTEIQALYCATDSSVCLPCQTRQTSTITA